MAETNRSEARKKPRNVVLRLLGPGLVTGAADDDPSGIATYSQAGAQFGYGLLWTVFLTTPFMIAIQLVSARIGRVTGKGLAANVMEAGAALAGADAGFSSGHCEHLQYRGRHRGDGRIPLARHWRPQSRTCPDLRIDIDLAAGLRAVSPIFSGAQISHADAVCLCRNRADREHSLEHRFAGGDLAHAHHQCRLLPDGGGGSRNHDQPLSVLLAGLAGSRGNEQGQGAPSASGPDPRRPDRDRPHQARYDDRHDLLQRDCLFHHSDHRRRVECPWHHQHQFGNASRRSAKAAGG